MRVLTVLKVGKVTIVGKNQSLRFYNASVIGVRIPMEMFDYFNCRDAVNLSPFEIKAGMVAQIVRGQEGLLGIIVSNSLVDGTIVPTTPFVEANLSANGSCRKGICINNNVDALSHWDSWFKNYNIDKIIDEREKNSCYY